MGTKASMGTFARILRILMVTLIVGLYFGGQVSGMIAIALLTLAVVFVVTGFMSVCPLYFPFHISTQKKQTITNH